MPFVREDIGNIIRRFGVSENNPAAIVTSGNEFNLFNQPRPRTSTNRDEVQPLAGDCFSGTADQFGALGYRAMPGLLLTLPSPGVTNPKVPTYVISGGSITIPPSASGASVSIVLNQNYFQAVNQTVEIFTNPIGTMITPQSLTPGTYFWNLLFAVGTQAIGVLGGGFVTINNVVTGMVTSVTPFSQFRPTVALSLGVQFGGSVTPPDIFACQLLQHEIQQIVPLDLVNRSSG